ncbi:MAG: glucosamine-6-phosphate deaminase [Bacillota bacterium]
MKIIVAKNYDELSFHAGEIIKNQIIEKPDSVLGLATGSSPVGTYKHLVAEFNAGKVSFAKAKSANLDEYVGIAKDHDQSYYYFMQDNLFSHVDIDVANTNIPNGLASDPDAECARYDGVIEALGGVDLQLLGIGGNGHIGFNEPAECFSKGTNKIALHDSTIEANARFFASKADVPTHAYSMGIGTIMKAKKILLVASGKDKAKAIAGLVKGDIRPDMPASILQYHPDVTVVCDEEAGALL